jgi:O-antigen/teichoic acid export membrane protein
MIKRILQHFAARVLTAGLSFVVVWLTARYLGAAGRGQISLFFTDVSGWRCWPGWWVARR